MIVRTSSLRPTWIAVVSDTPVIGTVPACAAIISRSQYSPSASPRSVIHTDDRPNLELEAHLDRRRVRYTGDRHGAGLRGNYQPEPVLPVGESEIGNSHR